jgi:IS5 family transposase
MGGQAGFFDLEDRLAALSAAGDPLERLSSAVNFEIFRTALKRALRRSDRGKGGRPPYDPVMMFKILVLQALYGLSDSQAEYQIRDRLSFMRFLGLGLGERAPDEKTIWLFRELLVRAGAIDKLFDRFEAALEAEGYLAMSGQIVDASLVAAPKQRNTDGEKHAIKEGRIPGDWKENPAKLRQKDRDARWTLKQGKKKQGTKVQLAIPHYGYKNHIATDRRHGLIRSWDVSHAAANDGKRLKGLLSRENTASPVWADTAYRSRANEAWMARNGFTSQIHHKKPPRKDLPRTLARANARRSKVRAAVEHVFAHQKDRMGLFVRTIGLGRARLKIGMVNLAYNMRRFLWLRGRTAPA